MQFPLYRSRAADFSCIVTCCCCCHTQDLELQHTAMVMDDAAGFLAAVGQLTALTRLAAGSNQLNDLPASWQQLKQLQVGTCTVVGKPLKRIAALLLLTSSCTHVLSRFHNSAHMHTCPPPQHACLPARLPDCLSPGPGHTSHCCRRSRMAVRM